MPNAILKNAFYSFWTTRRSEVQSRKGALPSERVEPGKPIGGVSWTQLANIEDEEEMKTKPKKSSTGNSWAELAVGSFELLDPYRVQGEEDLESLRSLADAENPVKTSDFR